MTVITCASRDISDAGMVPCGINLNGGPHAEPNPSRYAQMNGASHGRPPAVDPAADSGASQGPDATPAATGPGMGHNSGARVQPPTATVFEQFEAIVDSPDYSAAQKCMLVKIRCRVNAKTMDNAIVSNEGLMRAASLKDPRALRAELRDLQGKARDLPAQRDRQRR